MPIIHETAIVDSKAELAEDVEVGAWSWVGPHVVLGPGCIVEQRALIEGVTILGKDCKVCNGAVVGTTPQDLKYAGEPTKVIIGDNVLIREFVTINRAVGEGKSTEIGDRCFIMAYAHVAHNCLLESDVIMANAATLAGHIRIGQGAIIGGIAAIHQFVRVGRFSIVGGGSGVRQDILPFIKSSETPCRPFGLNYVGLKRHGYSREQIRFLKKAYKIIFRSGLRTEEAVNCLKKEYADNEDIQMQVRFIESSARGLAR